MYLVLGYRVSYYCCYGSDDSQTPSVYIRQIVYFHADEKIARLC